MSLKLYEYDSLITQAMDAAIDPDTGEIVDNEAMEMLNQLEGERDDKIESLLLWYKDLVAEADAVKAEKMNLAKRQSALENKAEHLKEFLQRYLAGEKFKTARVATSYRMSESVEWFGRAETLPEDLRIAKYEPDKTAIKNVIKAGGTVEGAVLVKKQNMQIK